MTVPQALVIATAIPDANASASDNVLVVDSVTTSAISVCVSTLATFKSYKKRSACDRPCEANTNCRRAASASIWNTASCICC